MANIAFQYVYWIDHYMPAWFLLMNLRIFVVVLTALAMKLYICHFGQTHKQNGRWWVLRSPE